jgi:membrane associated rhomboid family serine protease
MGESDRYIDYKDSGNNRRWRFTLGDPNNALMAIVAVNIIVFLIILVSRVFYLFTHQGQGMEILDFDATKWFALPAKLTTLSERPWTVLTFMFTHGGGNLFPLILNMLSNMLWLWTFGYVLQDLAGNRLIFPVYIYGSLVGAVFFIVACYALPVYNTHLGDVFLNGSGTGTTAIAIAVTTLNPQYRFFRNIRNGVPVWILTSIYMAIIFITAVVFGNANSFALLGSAVAGYLFIYLLQRGTDGSVWMINLYNWATNLFNPNKSEPNTGVKEKVFYNTGNRNPYKKTANVTQNRVDEILDKINQKGYHFLTDEEKNILKRASEE